MNKKYFIILFSGVLMAAALLSGCTSPEPEPSQQPPSTVSHGGPVRDYVSLIDNLRAAGAMVEPAGEINQPFFSVKGNAIDINGENVQVFEYADEMAAETEAASISPDGSSIGTSIVGWVAPPHFYQTGRIIVLYVGTSQETLNMLEQVLGPQVAGSPT